MKWVRITLEDSSYKVEEVKEEKEKIPRIRFICEPVNPNQQNCQMIAIIPQNILKDVVNTWEEVKEEEDETVILSKLLALIIEVDDNPDVCMCFNNYFLRIEINPD